MSETKLTVTVSGPVGSGKSAICGEIELAMKAIGVQVAWDDEGENNMTHADWASALDLYKPSVAIREDNPAMERERICRAAEAANAAFGQWVPEPWVHAFIKAFQNPALSRTKEG